MTLSISLNTHLDQVAALHTRLCPRQVLGVRMARFACTYLGIDPALERRQIYVCMEIGRCAADGVMVVTYASPMNQLMQLIPYGKVAATFVDLRSGAALRVSEHTQSRMAASQLSIQANSKWERELKAYQVLPDESILLWQDVTVNLSGPSIPEKHSIACALCGDRVHEREEVERDEFALCKACAIGAYYSAEKAMEA